MSALRMSEGMMRRPVQRTNAVLSHHRPRAASFLPRHRRRQSFVRSQLTHRRFHLFFYCFRIIASSAALSPHSVACHRRVTSPCENSPFAVRFFFERCVRALRGGGAFRGQ